MNTMFSAVLALAVSLTVITINASLLPAPPVAAPDRLTTISNRLIGDAAEVIGVFNLLAPQSGRKCPRRIEHTDVDVPQPHSFIKMNNNQCEGDGSMEILGTDSTGDISAVIDTASGMLTGEAKSLVESLRDISDSIGLLVIGLEKNGRDCGKFVPDKLEENTVVVILRTTSDVEIPKSTLRLDFRYMMVSSPNGQNCLYTARSAVSPSPSPASSMMVEPTMAPEPATTVPPTTESTSTTAETTTMEEEGDDDKPMETMEATAGNDDDEDKDDMADKETEGGHDGGVGGHDDEGHDDEGHDDEGHDDEGHDHGMMTTEPEVSPTPESDDDVCFPADATVTLESGSVKRMDAVQIGDRVHIGNGEYSDVFMFSHKVSDKAFKFVRLSTSGGRTISATKGHYLYLNGKLTAAGFAKVGDEVIGGDGSKDVVKKVEKDVTMMGLYNPQTEHGDIVVNDVKATTFTMTVQHCAAQALMAPVRWVYNMIGLTLNVLDNGGGKAASYMPAGQGIVGA